MKKTNCALHVYLSNSGISPDAAWAISRSHASEDQLARLPVQDISFEYRNPIAGSCSDCDGNCSSCCCIVMIMRFLVDNYEAAPDILTAFKERFMK